MNDFLKAMGQFGMEGLGIETETEVSLEQEMNEEIAMEAELDEAYAQMDFANIVASTSQCEAILTAMAEREIGLESNAGRDAAVIYGEFGLEAIKDVAMRKAYSGWASLKALINTCINWLKQLIGIQTASKKIFAGLAKKAKAMKKQLRKVQSKVSEKLTREMPKYVEAFEALLADYSEIVRIQRGANGTLDADQIAGIFDSAMGNTEEKVNRMISSVETGIDRIKRSSENLTDTPPYDKSNTNDYEGAAAFNHIIEAVTKLEALATANKSDDFVKILDKNIKVWERVRNNIDKKKDNQPPSNVGRYINKNIEFLTKQSGYCKKLLKEFVKAADDCLTMAKGIYATLV